ncbi:peptidoglycan-binding domain-containing protein [Streptomyces sp. NPDC094149]|uniref:peptidoglycan-binding domain-containing protein n=1 Tax=Streptomyces sp. NPDC094149 TaxID=3155079 RepID=UPI00332EBFEC
MTDPEGHLCPECGAPRSGDNTPSCGCAQRASEALREARTAQAAAAEDFDPLRIRPYVDLEGATEGTMPLRAVGPDLRPFETTAPPAPAAPPVAASVPVRHPGRRRPRTRTVLLAAGGAVVAVVAAAGLASGLFSYEPPSRDTALPDDVRASVPEAPTSRAPSSPSESAAPAGRPAPPSAPVGATPSPSASASATSASPSPSVTPTRSPATPTATSSATGTITSGNDQRTRPPVLRRGDSGPEVKELELRLTQLGLYTRKATGHYNEGVEDAVTRYQQARGIQPQQYGVYDLETRAHLESETSKP